MSYRRVLSGLLLGLTVSANAQLCVTDDADRQVCVPEPAKRIVALSPGATELLFAAGAGEHMAAAVSFSDYPPAARQLPRVGSYKRLDLEAILALQPDLIVAWGSGNPMGEVERLIEMGFAVYVSEPHRFDDVGSTIERFGKLAGTEAVAAGTANGFRAGIAVLKERYANAAPVTVFYQVWEDPLMTVNDEHLISEAIRTCGGVNVFGGLSSLAPRISREAVLKQNPEVIVAGGMGEDNPTWLEPWKTFKSLHSVQQDNLFFVAPSTLQRPTPQMLAGTRTLCQHLDTARARR